MSESRTVGWGMLGCGRVVDRRIAPAFDNINGARLVGFCSRDAGKAEAYRERHRAAVAYGSLEAMLDDEAIQAVYIATPNALHAEQATRCLQAGRHVLVDKPMATSEREAIQMVQAARQARRQIGVLHQQRFHPANMHLMRLHDEGGLGELKLLRIQIAMWYANQENWRWNPALSGGGAAMDLGPHAIDVMSEVAGAVRSVSAETRSLQFDQPVEDFCAARLEFESGAVGLLDLSYCTHHYGGRIEAFGSEATFIVDGSMQQAGVYQTWFRRGDTVDPPQQSPCTSNSYRDAIEDFSDAVLHSGTPSISPRDGVRTMRIIDAIYESARTGKTVALREGKEPQSRAGVEA